MESLQCLMSGVAAKKARLDSSRNPNSAALFNCRTEPSTSTASMPMRQTKRSMQAATVKVKLCRSIGCTNQTQIGGVCMRHGAKRKLKQCRKEGCTNQAKKGGVCKKHGAKVKIKLCSIEG